MLQNPLFNVPQSDQDKKFSGKYIYETKGRAREYRELACNLYTGCDHGCVYCYAPDILRRDRKDFHVGPVPRTNIIANIDKESQKYVASGETRQVLLCFACDPYCKADQKFGITRKAIQTLHKNGMSVCTLTKGGTRALRDLDLFTKFDSFASTLTTLDHKTSLEWEPGAANPSDRIQALQEFHYRGIPTWVSLEPVIDPAETIRIIHETKEFVDEFKVGVLNYHPRASEIDWVRFAHEVKDTLDTLGVKYYLKKDLRILL